MLKLLASHLPGISAKQRGAMYPGQTELSSLHPKVVPEWDRNGNQIAGATLLASPSKGLGLTSRKVLFILARGFGQSTSADFGFSQHP